MSKINVQTSRFREAPWYEEDVPVLIGGAGGIGSWLSLFLARQQCQIYIYDNDNFEEVNMAGQFFKRADINKPKTIATQENIRNFTNVYNFYTFGLYDEESITNRITFAAFDNMKARKLMFDLWVKEEVEAKQDDPQFKIFIDGRLNAEEAEIYVVTPDKIEDYRKTLFDDSEASPLNCSYKSTSHCSAMIASLMTSAYNNAYTNYKLNLNYREFPFSIKYQLPLFKVEITP